MWCKFEVALKQNYATEVTYSETCLRAKIWVCHFTFSFCSFNPVASALGREDSWHGVVTAVGVMQFALQMTEVQSTNHKIILICMNFGVMYF